MSFLNPTQEQFADMVAAVGDMSKSVEQRQEAARRCIAAFVQATEGLAVLRHHLEEESRANEIERRDDRWRDNQ